MRVSAFAHFAGITEVLPMSRSNFTIGFEVMTVNYFSACEILSTLLKRRINGEALRNILLITSIAAEIGARHQPHYCASKGAIRSLTLALARDLAPHVRVNAIAPGSFQTGMWNTPLRQELPLEKKWQPGILPSGTPEDIAATAEFLLANSSHYITGSIFTVDGGERFTTGKGA